MTSNVTTSFDASGLPTSSSNSVGGETVTYTHDNIGDLTVANSSTNANDWAYSFDAYARMSCAKSAATACTSGTTMQTSVYDALDRTISTTLNSATTSNTFRGVTDALTRRVGTVTTAYAVSAQGTPIAEKGSSTNPFFYLRDPHGDIVSSVTTAAANQTTRTFDPYGKPLTTTQVSGSQPVPGFQGDLTDPTTSLVDMGTRYYQSTTGRFTSRDMVAGDPTSPMSLNLFAYAEMNPISNFDPTGMSCDRYTGRCGTGYTTANGQYKHYNQFTGTTTTSGSGGTYETHVPVPIPRPKAPWAYTAAETRPSWGERAYGLAGDVFTWLPTLSEDGDEPSGDFQSAVFALASQREAGGEWSISGAIVVPYNGLSGGFELSRFGIAWETTTGHRDQIEGELPLHGSLPSCGPGCGIEEFRFTIPAGNGSPSRIAYYAMAQQTEGTSSQIVPIIGSGTAEFAQPTRPNCLPAGVPGPQVWSMCNE